MQNLLSFVHFQGSYQSPFVIHPKLYTCRCLDRVLPLVFPILSSKKSKFLFGIKEFCAVFRWFKAQPLPCPKDATGLVYSLLISSYFIIWANLTYLGEWQGAMPLGPEISPPETPIRRKLSSDLVFIFLFLLIFYQRFLAVCNLFKFFFNGNWQKKNLATSSSSNSSEVRLHICISSYLF